MNPTALESGDSDELEALFDSIVKANTASTVVPEPAPAPAPIAEPTFEDVISAAVVASEGPAPVVAQSISAEDEAAKVWAEMNEPAQSMFSQIGHLTRKLHDALHELGYDVALERAASSIPDARDRLAYIASLTEQAAERCLNAVDAATPPQEKMEAEANKLSADWDRLFNKQMNIEEFKLLVSRTRGYLKEVPKHTSETKSQLMEIMMAQDFQDLTGQVIKKIVSMAKEMEDSLYGFLLEFSPPSTKAKREEGLLNGPVVNAEGRTDVVTDQQQVDDLLASLGF